MKNKDLFFSAKLSNFLLFCFLFYVRAILPILFLLKLEISKFKSILKIVSPFISTKSLTLIFFSLAYVVGWFLEYSLADISGVLSIIIAAYFGSRGVEKFTKIKNK